MQAESDDAFDFDRWMDLAQRDPQQFELARTQAVDAACARMASDRRLLAGLRWRIDMERARCRTPLQCCLRLYSMMWDRFYDLDRSMSGEGGGQDRAPAKVLDMTGAEKALTPEPG